jgi:hypothetical protein
MTKMITQKTALEAMAAARRQTAGVEFGEGFRQHLGHGYPQDNLLATELGPLVYSVSS